MMSLNKPKLSRSLILVLALALFLGFQKAPRLLPGMNYVQSDFLHPPQESHYVPGQVIVKFKPSLSSFKKMSALNVYSSRILSKIAKLGAYLIQIPAQTTVEEIVHALNNNPDVEYAEPNRLLTIHVTPNDTFFQYQYALYNKGQQVWVVPGSPQGKASADIKAPSAWEETKGVETVIIAIVDTGVDLLHPDLKNKIKSSGRDVFNNDFDATDDHGHGTVVAGIAAAETNNNEGIAGVAWNSKILPVKVTGKDGIGPEDKVAEGIRWAVDNGANVINLSMGSEEPTFLIRDAMKYAYDKNVVVAVSAGNSNGPVHYPAAYDDYVLAVAATDYNDNRTSWSSYGPQVDVAAPGDKVLGPYPVALTPAGFFPYLPGTGTSFSAPHVAGLAALIKGLKPWLKVADIMNVIRYSADDVNAAQFKGRDDYIGYGRINMEKALVPIKIIQ
jgi:subtilisin family serine protease